MQIKFWATTDVGRTRDHNEDNFLVDPKLNLFIVADGMGGHAAGEVASSVAVHEVRKAITDQREVIENYERSGSVLMRQTILTLIERAISIACRQVHRLAQEDSERHGMGTTLSMLLISKGRGFIGHVGDSRIYRGRDGKIDQLTEDHSVINELIKSGRLKPGEAFDSPYKNAVTRAVGVHPTVEVDTFDFDIKVGDQFLLCSDGLSCYLEERDDITLDFFSYDNLKEVPKLFIDHANESGGKDNITAIVVRVKDRAVKEQVDDQPVDETHAIRDDSKSSSPPPLPPSLDSDERPNPSVNSIESIQGLNLEVIKLSPIFSFLGDRYLEALARYAEIVKLSPNEVLFMEGQVDEDLIVIIQGTVRLERESVKIGTRGPGMTLGEERLLSKRANSLSAVTDTHCTLLKWSRFALYHFMSQDPLLALRLVWGAAQLSNQRVERLHEALVHSYELLTERDGTTLPPSLASPVAVQVNPSDELIPRFLLELETPVTPLFQRPPLAGDVEAMSLAELEEDFEEVMTRDIKTRDIKTRDIKTRDINQS